MHHEGIAFLVITPGAAPGTLAGAAAGDSATIKMAAEDSKISLVNLSHRGQVTAGSVEIFSPLMHDSTHGYMSETRIGSNPNLLPLGSHEPLRRGDTLSVRVVGSAVAGDVEQTVATIIYDDFPGINMDLVSLSDIRDKIKHITTVHGSVAAGAAAGWSPGISMAGMNPLLHADSRYALLGARTFVACGAVGVRAPDWGGARVVIPEGFGIDENQGHWFPTLGERLDRPMCPTFLGSNTPAIMVYICQDENLAATIVSLTLAEYIP